MIRLSDVFIPSVYGSYMAVNNPETSAFVEAGIVASNDALNAIARQGGKLPTMPFWQDIDPALEPNYSNDDPADIAVPNKIGTGTMTARTAWLNQGFAEMDLVVEMSAQEPLQHVRNRFGTYWTRQLERRVIATCVGILADNVANDGGDMIVDISAADTTNDANAQKFNGDVFVDAAYTMGDQAESIRAIAVHSAIMARMVKDDDIDWVQSSSGGIRIPTYKGRTVVVDDQLPVSGSGADRIFTSILFGGGAFGFGSQDGNVFAIGVGTPKTPFELERSATTGNGGGSESIWERKTWLTHPLGFDWVEGGAALAEMSPTLADLRLAAHWDRVVDRKNCPIAFIKSKA